MKKLLFTLFAALLTLNVAAQVPQSVSSQKFGENFTWEFNWDATNEQGTLIIKGNGIMPTFANNAETPWYKHSFGKFMSIDITVALFTHKLIIEDGITSISTSAFAAMNNLIEISLPASLTEIASGAFSTCNNLTSITGNCDLTRVNIKDDTFINTGLISNSGELYLAQKLIRVFESYEAKEIKIKEGTTEICKNAFLDNEHITKIDFTQVNGTLTKIGDNAFSGCEKLIYCNIPNSVETFGTEMFKDCDKINVTNGYKLAGCVLVKPADPSLRKYNIPSTVKFIAEEAFSSCDKVKFMNYHGTQAPKTTTSSLPSKYLKYTTLIPNNANGYDSNTFININTTVLNLKAYELTTCTFLHDAIIPEGVSAYRAELGNGEIKLIRINPNKVTRTIPKGKGIILKSYETENYTFNFTYDAQGIDGQNDLKPCTQDIYLTPDDNAYGIKKDESGNQHFVHINSYTTMPVGKAYIQATGNNVRIVYEDPEMEHAWETSIEDVNTDNNKNNARIYNMAGQRLNSTQSGLNIVDGKIVIK